MRINRIPRKVSLVLLLVTALVLSSLMIAAAQPTDGRINQIAHLGGAAVYCVDENFNPSNNYGDGGIRVLDIDGQELLFVPAAEIDAAGEFPAEPVVLGEASGPYGPMTLYLLPNNDFQLNGVDEHGKEFAFPWRGCAGVGPAAPASVGTSAPGSPMPTMIPTISPESTPEVFA